MKPLRLCFALSCDLLFKLWKRKEFDISFIKVYSFINLNACVQFHFCVVVDPSAHTLCLSWVEKKEGERKWNRGRKWVEAEVTAEGYVKRRRAGGKEAEGNRRNSSRGTLKTLTEKMTRVQIWGKVRKRAEEEKLRKWKEEGKKGGRPRDSETNETRRKCWTRDKDHGGWGEAMRNTEK